jgi:DtxR family Mn-dependent transcriptional regulator
LRKFEANSALFNENLRNVWPAYTAFAVDSLFSDSLLVDIKYISQQVEALMNELQEEILEAVWTADEKKLYSIEAIKNQCPMEISNHDLVELEKNDMITRDGNDIFFKEKGKSLAETIIRRHRLAEVLVTSILKLKSTEMEKVACQVEHSLHPEVEQAICTLLGHPEICPDGKPIPPGQCCRQGICQIQKTVVTLTDLEPGETGKITYIKPISHSNLHQLISFGLNPGVIVTVHRKSPAFCIKYENTELALDESIAENIFVWRL